MILARERLAFVHIPKTGGTSIELFFSGHDWIAADPSDYQIYLRERAQYSPTWGGTLCAKDPDYFGKRLREKHATQAQLRAACGAAWPTLRKFTFLRNPYERILSIHAHGVRDGHGRFEPDFRRWLLQPEPRDHMGQLVFVEWLDDPGELDFVGRFEHLDEDFARLLELLEWPHRAPLPFERHGNRGHHDLAAAYDASTRRVVAARCATELELGSYRFPGN
jgi:hypothetical protein